MNNTTIFTPPPEAPFKYNKGDKVVALKNQREIATTKEVKIVDRLRIFTLDKKNKPIEIHYYILEGYGNEWFNQNQIQILNPLNRADNKWWL